jgi:hypothetical protein
MRTKRLKYILILVSIVIMLFSSWYYYGIFTPYNYFTAKRDILNSDPRLLVYGFPPQNDQQQHKTARSYGFTYYSIAGCVVNAPLVNGADAYNNVTNDYLEGKLGSGWKKKFRKDVDSLYRLESGLIALVSGLDFIKVKQQELRKEGNGLHYYPVYEKENGLYRIDVNGYYEDEFVSYYRVYLSPEDSVVKKIETGIIKYTEIPKH